MHRGGYHFACFVLQGCCKKVDWPSGGTSLSNPPAGPQGPQDGRLEDIRSDLPCEVPNPFLFNACFFVRHTISPCGVAAIVGAIMSKQIGINRLGPSSLLPIVLIRASFPRCILSSILIKIRKYEIRHNCQCVTPLVGLRCCGTYRLYDPPRREACGWR